MGFPMAGHLVTKGGHELTVYNRSRAKANAWAGRYKGRFADTPAKAAEGQTSCSPASATIRTCAKSRWGRTAPFRRWPRARSSSTIRQPRRKWRGSSPRGKKSAVSIPRCAGIGRSGGCRERTAHRHGGRRRRCFRAGETSHRTFRQGGDADGGLGRRPTHQDGQPDLHSGLVEALAEGLNFAIKAGLTPSSF